MAEEESESNTPETLKASPEGEAPENPETPDAPNGDEPESPPLESGEPPKEVVLSEEEHTRLLQAEVDRDQYRDDLLKLKNSKRKKELFADPVPTESPEVPETPNATPFINDYLSKRKDIMDEYADALGKLPDAAFSTVQASLRSEEDHLRRTLTDYVSRVQIKKMFDSAIDYARFKHGLQKPEPSTEEPEDFGSTKTIRKPFSPGKRKISDRAYAIAKESQTKDGGLTPEKVQDMLDRGQIK